MRKWSSWLLATLVLGAGWLWLVDWSYRTQAPRGTTLREVLPQTLERSQSRVFEQDGQEYLAVFGRILIVPPRFPSGAPVYVFDSAGRLVDWTHDDGDAESFNRRWSRLYRGRTITRDELMQWPGAPP